MERPSASTTRRLPRTSDRRFLGDQGPVFLPGSQRPSPSSARPIGVEPSTPPWSTHASQGKAIFHLPGTGTGTGTLTGDLNSGTDPSAAAEAAQTLRIAVRIAVRRQQRALGGALLDRDRPCSGSCGEPGLQRGRDRLVVGTFVAKVEEMHDLPGTRGELSNSDEPDPAEVFPAQSELLELLSFNPLDPMAGGGAGSCQCGKQQSRPVVFLVGAALATQKVATDELRGKKGVADVNEVVEMVSRTLEKPGASAAPGGSPSRYQQAFEKLIPRRGPGAAQATLADAVAKAFVGTSEGPCDAWERQATDWVLTDGSVALGAIVTEFPERFGPYLLTTNYDPTLALSILRARGRVIQTALHGDGNPGQTIMTQGLGCHLVHLHGYWRAPYDALHTQQQLNQPRPQLLGFLCDLLRRFRLVVIGYGGWDDLFSSAAAQVAQEQYSSVDIVWCFYDAKKDPRKTAWVQARLAPARGRGLVTYYDHIDAHEFLPKLLSRLRTGAESTCRQDVTRGCWLLHLTHGQRRLMQLSGDGGDRGAIEYRAFDDYFQVLENSTASDSSPRADWRISDQELVISSWSEEAASVRETKVPNVFQGPVNWCFNVLRLERESSKAEESWAKECISALPRNGREDAIKWQVRLGHAAIPGVIVHLLPATIKRFSVEQVTAGQWLKVLDFGGCFLVKLLPDGTLIESALHDPAERWKGVWWISEDGCLHFWIGNWRLDLDSSDFEDRAGVPFYRGTEYGAMGKEAEGKKRNLTKLLVAPVTWATAGEPNS